jgi:2-polyprenyl-3-methyl-5-hydroxy-6-metoxy-1,4-benzoquinol methylase
MKSATTAWTERIEAHHEQTHRARGDQPEHADMWSTLADNFRADPRRTDDPVVNFLLPFTGPDKTVLDVGGGAGRYALPLALRSSHVTVVEPSPSMTSALTDAANAAVIENVTAVPATWEDAEVEPADVVLCANVVYGVADIGPFVQQLNDHARDLVAIIAYMDAPSSMMSPLWEAVHGEERINLPAAPELLLVLWELGIFPNLQVLPPGAPRAAPSMEIAIQFARVFLYVQTGTEADGRLMKAAEELAVETPDGITLRQAQTRPQAVLWWRPDEFGSA